MNIQTVKTLMGFGKPLVQSSVTENQAVEPENRFRQAPCDKMVGYINIVLSKFVNYKNI